MATVDELVSGSGEIIPGPTLNDLVVTRVISFGNSIELDGGSQTRLLRVGWWSPLTIFDYYGDEDDIFPGPVYFIDFRQQAQVALGVDLSYGYHGIRYNLLPGVEVRFLVDH